MAGRRKGASLIDPKEHARLAAWVARVERLVGARGPVAAPFPADVAALYAEVGAYVHWLMRRDGDDEVVVDAALRALRSPPSRREGSIAPADADADPEDIATAPTVDRRADA